MLMPYKQGVAIDSKSSLLIRHHFYYLDMTASVDQNWESKRRSTMNNIIKSTLAFGLVVAAAVLPTLPAEAEIHSRSKELVIMEARDLPEQAQTPGNSLFFTPTVQEARIFMWSSSKALDYQSLMSRIRLASSW
jgi:hypothetical protein